MNKQLKKEDKQNNSNIPIEEKARLMSLEMWVLLFGFSGFLIFIGIIIFLLLPLLRGAPTIVSLSPQLIEAAATRGLVLPPTWTPSPEPEIYPTATGTAVHDGSVPTPIYTITPTSSLTGLPMPQFGPRGSKVSIIDLARIMQGESPGDTEAAYRVGWVAKNRLRHPSYGDTYFMVSHGFFGYRADMEPNETFIELAQRVIRAQIDPTGGCLYALSRTDITKLGVPEARADIAYGEWFFFKSWPVGGR